jgi:uncharacterized protein (DUF1330 family)
MKILDDSWIESYFATVPAILAEYGGISIAGGREIMHIEGRMPAPDRMAILSFPSLKAIEQFMADERYQPFRQQREQGAASEIFAFENAVTGGELV